MNGATFFGWGTAEGRLMTPEGIVDTVSMVFRLSAKT